MKVKASASHSRLGRPLNLGPKAILQALVIVALILAVYGPSLRGDWLWDDTQLIQNNVLVHDPGGWWKIWLQPGRLIDYQPITTMLFWLEWHLWGNATLGYHLTNVLLHAVGSILVWRLLVRLGVRAAWLGGLLFAVHPLVVESVAWMAEAKNVLSLPPFLLALIAWIDFSEHGRARDYRRALGLFLVALLCKATVIMFPVLILLYAWWRHGRIERRDFQCSIPFFVLSMLIGAVTIWFLHRNALERPELPALGGIDDRIAGAGLILAFYVGKCFWPFGLMPVYRQWAVNPLSPFPYFAWLIFALIIAGLWRKRRSWGRHVLLGLFFFAINLAPFLGFTTGSYMAFTWVIDHILYVPLIGLIGLAAAAWGEMERRLSVPLRTGLVGVTAAALILLGLASHAYAGMFRDSETLWSYTLQHNPESWIAHSNLAQALEHEGRHVEALALYQEAAKLRPRDANLHCNLGRIFDETGRTRESLEQYAEALAIDPRSAIAYCNRGVVYTQLGQLPNAMADYETALAIKPDYPEAHSDLGVALSESNRPVDAIAQYQAAVAENPDYAVAHANLGNALGETGHFTEALDQYREVLRIDPHNASARYDSGVALTQLGRIAEAMDEYRAALKIDPHYTNARNNLSSLEKQGIPTGGK